MGHSALKKRDPFHNFEALRLIDEILIGEHFCENSISPIEMGSWNMRNKPLGTFGVFAIGSHSKHSGPIVLGGRNFRSYHVSRSAGTGGCAIPGLYDEVRDDAMKHN